MTAVTRPLYIRMHAADNVAIVVNDGGVPAGAVFEDGLAVREAVPQGHKVALTDLPAGCEVRRYNVVIGRTTRDVPAGSWVHERLLEMPQARALEGLPVATVRPTPQPWRAIPLRAIATPTAAWARATCWPSPRRCNA
jgi:galactarate dehydratase